MSAWPSTYTPRGCQFKLRTNQRANAAPGGGSEQVIDMLNDRWVATLTLGPRTPAEAAGLEAFLASMRGMVGTVDVWHFVRPLPRGTLRGSPLTSGTQAQGAASLVISAAGAGATVFAGDLLGAGGQLLMASADATADGSGNITVPLANRLRAAIATGQAVTWSKPTVPFRILDYTPVTYEPGMANEVTVQLGEVIS